MNTPKTHWELKLSSLHAVVLVGLITGSMVAAFYLGFLSGNRLGFDEGQQASLAHTPRIPIPARETDFGGSAELSGDMAVSEQVYDQLAAAPNTGASTAEIEELPALGKIAAAPVRELADSSANLGGTLGAADTSEREESIAAAVSAGALEQDFKKTKPTSDTDTLGALDEPRVAIQRAVNPQALVPTEDLIAAKSRLAAENAAIVAQGRGEAAMPPAAPTSKPVLATPTGSKPVSTPIPAKPPSAAIQPVPVPAVSKTLVRDSLPNGWYAQVAAPKTISEAETLAARLKRSGFPVLIERANVRGEAYFRVVVGPEKDKVQVDRLVSQVKREGFEPFPRAVK